MREYYELTLDEMVDLEFGHTKGKSKIEGTSATDPEMLKLIGKNILILKELRIQPGDGLIKAPCFHSRRVQYSFAKFMLNRRIHWIDKEDERIRYQQRLERIRCQHILGFEVYLLKKKTDDETINQLEREIEDSTDSNILTKEKQKLKDLIE